MASTNWVRLDRDAPVIASAPLLDEDQAAVVAHRGGPMLVLAGPGTGKTTTLVEVVAARLSDPKAGLRPEQVLALTFGRRAANDLRERICARLAGAGVPAVLTFHAFAFAAVRAHGDQVAFPQPPKLLTAGEQEARLRELMAGAIADGRLNWPADLAGSLGTAGIAEQVRDLFSRVRGLGLDGEDLSRFGRAGGIQAWVALGGFLEEYLDALGFEGAVDYGELMHQAVALAHDRRSGAALREMFKLIVVDEYQDTDPAQVELLAALASQGADLIVVGDPDQAIYGFRGAEVRGILDFPDRFTDARGRPAPIVVLGTTRRFSVEIAEAAGRVLASTALAPLPIEVQRKHRSPRPAPWVPPSKVEVLTYPCESAQASGIADILRRAHLLAEPGKSPLDWSQMAILVRSPSTQIPGLASGLAAAGIPVWVPTADLPLGQQPAVSALVDLIRAAQPGAAISPGLAHDLLCGPIGRLDPVRVRALTRGLVRARRAEGSALPPQAGLASPDLLAWVLTDPGNVDEVGGLEPDLTSAVACVAGVLESIRDRIIACASPHDVLWTAWSATDWPKRLRSAAFRSGAVGRAADRDLDSVMALFDLAGRMPERLGGIGGVRTFLGEVASQEVPVDSRATRANVPAAVALLSVHRAKGLAWPLVVVAGVQDGRWPDLRARSQLLRAQELGPNGLESAPGHGDLLVEERRLMYVAATRAQGHLVVTSVDEPIDGGLQPSRFLAEMSTDIVDQGKRPSRHLSGTSVVGALRAIAEEPIDGSQADVCKAQVARREAACARLAWLAHQVHDGEPVFRGADPQSWWMAKDLSQADRPVLETGQPISLSATMVTDVLDCPLRWFLNRKVGAAPTAAGAVGVGRLIHAIAAALVAGTLPAESAALNEAVDQVWSKLPVSARYFSDQEREQVRAMLGALLAWHRRDPGRAVVAAEHRFDVVLPDAQGGIRLRGSIDRIERDGDGGYHLLDFKTGGVTASAAGAKEHPQLATYQVAALFGALEGLHHELAGTRQDGSREALGGAELVFLRNQMARTGLPAVREQPGIQTDPQWALDLLGEVAQLLREERFEAHPGPVCTRCSFKGMCPTGSSKWGETDEISL